MHRFPKDPVRRKRWIDIIKTIRPNWEFPKNPDSNVVVCSDHFKPTDFVTDSQDKTERRKRKRESQTVRRYHKEDASPSVFPNCPSYFPVPEAIPDAVPDAIQEAVPQPVLVPIQEPVPEAGPSGSTNFQSWFPVYEAVSQTEEGNEHLEIIVEKLIESREITSFPNLLKTLDSSLKDIPDGYHVLKLTDKVYIQKFVENIRGIVEIASCLIIKEDLTFSPQQLILLPILKTRLSVEKGRENHKQSGATSKMILVRQYFQIVRRICRS